jgi:hypothetical protein
MCERITTIAWIFTILHSRLTVMLLSLRDWEVWWWNLGWMDLGCLTAILRVVRWGRGHLNMGHLVGRLLAIVRLLWLLWHWERCRTLNCHILEFVLRWCNVVRRWLLRARSVVRNCCVSVLLLLRLRRRLRNTWRSLLLLVWICLRHAPLTTISRIHILVSLRSSKLMLL